MIRKKEYLTGISDSNDKTLVDWILLLASSNQSLDIYLFYRVEIVCFKANKVYTSGYFQYANYIDVFFKNILVKLSEHIKINNNTIKLV